MVKNIQSKDPKILKSRTVSRLYAVQALFQMEANNISLNKVIYEFKNYRIGSNIDGFIYHDADEKLFIDLINNAVDNQKKIDNLTDIYLKDTWTLGRIDPTLRAIFRAALSELIYSKSPPKVIINEFIEISKAFFPEGKEFKLVNAMLDKIYNNMNNSKIN
tara:strand:- start:144 stop:626 length:483 start_codon:yes stop_codon:yes gene_type:complete